MTRRVWRPPPWPLCSRTAESGCGSGDGEREGSRSTTGIRTVLGAIPGGTAPTAWADGRVNAIVEDKSGPLWLGTPKGLDRFDPETGPLHALSGTAPG